MVDEAVKAGHRVAPYFIQALGWSQCEALLPKTVTGSRTRMPITQLRTSGSQNRRCHSSTVLPHG